MMRETLRGTLLSVLFFGLMVGGLPTMARADVQQPTDDETITASYHNQLARMIYDLMVLRCEQLRNDMEDAGALGALGTLLILIPDPATTTIGGILAGIAAWGALLTYMEIVEDCRPMGI